MMRRRRQHSRLSPARVVSTSICLPVRAVKIWNSTSNQPVGTWSDQYGVSHSISNHNLLTEPAWFFPTFLITHGLSFQYAANRAHTIQSEPNGVFRFQQLTSE